MDRNYLYSWFYGTIVLPIVDISLCTSVSRLGKLFQTTQWWSEARLRAWQEERLALLVEHAYKNVPYYRRVMQERGLEPGNIISVRDLSKLPILTRETVRREYDSLISQDIASRHVKRNSTGGTTGEPLHYWADWQAWSADWACLYRGLGFASYQPGNKIATLAGSSLVPNAHSSPTQRIRLKLERNLPLSVVTLSEERSREYARKLIEFQPQFLRGYPTALCVFAQHVETLNLSMPQLKAVFTTAELLQPQHREVIERVFDCPVFDGYGCRDGGANAMECDHHEGMHLSLDRAVVEFLDDADCPSNHGQMILTDLFNYAMPFIRYKVGDVGALSAKPCGCGRGLPLLAKLEGRITDILTFGNGVTLSGPAVTLIFRNTSFLQYQLCQQDEFTLMVRYVCGNKDRNEADLHEIRRILQHHLGAEIRLLFEQVEDIPPTAAGKRRFIISEFRA